ncbi:RNA-directed DNA polymerase [Arachis hypogaea]|nr:RNA-directed DNA polymerase [Arachis hypogaea]
MSWFLHNSKQRPFRFFSGLWWIWCSRNNEIFHLHEHWTTDKVIGMALSLEKELRNIFELQRLSIPSTISGSWIPPSVGTFMINCDASYPGSGARVGFACVSRDWKGRWQRGCLGIIESRSILQGELFAIWRGFLLAWDSGQRDIICETDCVEAFTIVNNLQDCSGFIDHLVLKIRDIMS